MFCDSILCYLHFNCILLWGRLEIQPPWNVMEISHFYWICQLGKVKQLILYWWLLLNLVKLLSLSSWEKSNLLQNLEETSNSSSLLLWGKNLEVDFRSKSPKSDSLWSEQIEPLNLLVKGHVRNNSGWLFLSYKRKILLVMLIRNERISLEGVTTLLRTIEVYCRLEISLMERSLLFWRVF